MVVHMGTLAFETKFGALATRFICAIKLLRASQLLKFGPLHSAANIEHIIITRPEMHLNEHSFEGYQKHWRYYIDHFFITLRSTLKAELDRRP